MGADYIGQVTTVVESRYTNCTKEALVRFLNPDEVVQRLVDGDQFLAEQVDNTVQWDPDYDADEPASSRLQIARDILIEGWETLTFPRYHNYWPLGRGLALITGGGMSWGDDPYDGYDQESTLVGTALTDSELGALTGIVAGVPEVDFIESWLQSGEGA
jgi:hypothetical protein